jgi:hypothetical protein
MTQRKPLVFELLNKTHDRTSFSCEVAALETYLKEQAGQELPRHLAFPAYLSFSRISPYKPSRNIKTPAEQ